MCSVKWGAPVLLVLLSSLVGFPGATAPVPPATPLPPLSVGDILLTDTRGSKPGALLRFDPETGGTTELVVGGLLKDPRSLDIGIDGQIYIQDGFYSPVILRIDPRTGQQAVVAKLGWWLEAVKMTAAPDGYLYCTTEETAFDAHVKQVDPRTGSIATIAQQGLLEKPRGIRPDGQGNLLVLVDGVWKRLLRIDIATGAQTRLGLNTHSIPELKDLVIGSDGNGYAVGASITNVARVFVGTGELERLVQIPRIDMNACELTADGRLVMTALTRVLVLDLVSKAWVIHNNGQLEECQGITRVDQDLTGPTCAAGAPVREPSGARYLPLTVADAESGVSQVGLERASRNVLLEWDTPSGTRYGTSFTSQPPVASLPLRARWVNRNKPVRIELRGTGGTGLPAIHAYSVETLGLAARRRRVSRTLSGLSHLQRFLRVHFESAGLSEVTVVVNGRPVATIRPGSEASPGFDLQPWLRPGSRNRVAVTAKGSPGGSAVVVLGSSPPG